MYLELLDIGIKIMPETDFEIDYLRKMSKHGLDIIVQKTLDTKSFHSLDVLPMGLLPSATVDTGKETDK